MNKSIYLDCDGTWIDLYGVHGWLDDLLNEDIRPYRDARPLVNLSVLARTLNKLQEKGYTINIISWTSKNSSEEYHNAVREAKLRWLAKHMKSVKWDNIYIVKYGTPKFLFGEGILFDDEAQNRNSWNGLAFSEKNLIKKLRQLLA